MIEPELWFRIVREGALDEVLARAMNLKLALGAYRAAVQEYPKDRILLMDRARIIEKSRP